MLEASIRFGGGLVAAANEAVPIRLVDHVMPRYQLFVEAETGR
jgi:hypothetical protein